MISLIESLRVGGVGNQVKACINADWRRYVEKCRESAATFFVEVQKMMESLHLNGSAMEIKTIGSAQQNYKIIRRRQAQIVTK